MVKSLLKEERVEILPNVEATLNSKVITIKGPKGTLSRSFARVPVQISAEYDKNKKITAINVRVWFAKSKPRSTIKTICSHIDNMMNGVTKGYTTVMKFGFNLIPMQPVAVENGDVLNVINYIGEKRTRKIRASPGVKVTTPNVDTKKEIEVSGINCEAVGETCARINQACTPLNKDRRKFKDGLYVFSRGFSA